MNAPPRRLVRRGHWLHAACLLNQESLMEFMALATIAFCEEASRSVLDRVTRGARSPVVVAKRKTRPINQAR